MAGSEHARETFVSEKSSSRPSLKMKWLRQQECLLLLLEKRRSFLKCMGSENVQVAEMRCVYQIPEIAEKISTEEGVGGIFGGPGKRKTQECENLRKGERPTPSNAPKNTTVIYFSYF